MGTISVTLPSDGQTIDASDVNTPINTIVDEMNGSLDSENIANGGVVPNSLFSGTGTSWAWQSWTPTLTNITEGNGTVTADYVQIGKTVFFTFSFILGSTSAMGSSPSFSLPVTSVGVVNAGHTIGDVRLRDATGASHVGIADLATTTKVQLYYCNAATSSLQYAGISASAPFSWTENDGVFVSGFYEAA